MDQTQAALFKDPTIRKFFSAVIDQDIPTALECFSDDVVVTASFFPETVVGKEGMLESFSLFASIPDKFVIKRVFHNGVDTGTMMEIHFDGLVIDGLDYTHQNTAGLIDRLLVMWRPLEAILAFRNRMAAATGMPMTRLVIDQLDD